jgi:hypothetical protein
VDEHLLVVVGGSRRYQEEPDSLRSRANQAIKDQALQISAGHAGQAPSRRPGGRAQTKAAACAPHQTRSDYTAWAMRPTPGIPSGESGVAGGQSESQTAGRG